MMILRRLVIFCCVLALSGCVSVQDQSDKYRAFIGKKFTTRYDAILWKMERHQFDIVPYKLKTIRSNGGQESYGRKEVFVPAGTVVTVRDAKVSYVGGDWDFIIAELERPDTKQTVVFEEMLGFSNVDPRKFYALYAPFVKEEPNQSLEPTPAAGTSAAEQPLVPAAVVAHL